MPSLDNAPNIGLLTAQDMRAHTGAVLFTRDTTSISFPTFTNTQGVYEDAVDLLNGYGAGVTVAEITNAFAVLAASATTGSWVFTIGSDDKITITANTSFTISHVSGVDYIGIGAGLGSVLVGGSYVATAPSEWVRGQILGPWAFQIVTTEPKTLNVTINGNSQDLRVLLRARGLVSDADDQTDTLCIESIDNDEMSSTTIKWLIDNDGYTVCSYPTAMHSITWNNTTFRDALGFTGLEVPSISGTHSNLKSSYPCQGVLIPSRPVERHRLSTESLSTTRRRLGGGMVSNALATYIISHIDFILDAEVDIKDLYRHFTDRFISLTGPGQKLNYYGEWGDSRRNSVESVQRALYTVLYTVQRERGRYRGRLKTGEFDLSYPSDLRRRVPVSLSIEHDNG